MLRKFSTGTQVTADVAATSSQNQLGTYYGADSIVRVTQPLLRGFGRAETLRQVSVAESGVAISESARQILERQVALDVAAAYYDVIRQKQLVRVAQASFERAEQLSASSAAKLEVGRVSQLDVLRADDLRSQADAARVDAGAAVEEAADRLKQLLGWTLNHPLAVAEEIVPPPPVELPGDPVAVALVSRLEIRSAEAAVASGDLDVAAARDSLRPQVDFGVSLTSQGVGNTLRSSFSSIPRTRRSSRLSRYRSTRRARQCSSRARSSSVAAGSAISNS